MCIRDSYPRKAVSVITGYGLSTSLVKVLMKSLKDSPRARVYRQGRYYSRVADFSINAGDAAIGSTRASKNKDMWTKNADCVFYCCRAREKRYIVRQFTYEYCSSMEKQ